MKEVPFLLCRWHSTGTSSPEAVQPPRWRSPKATWPWAWHLLWVCCWGRGCTWWTQRCVPASDILWSVFWLFFVVFLCNRYCTIHVLWKLPLSSQKRWDVSCHYIEGAKEKLSVIYLNSIFFSVELNLS